MNATPQFIGALTEMVWAQIGIFRSSVGDRGCADCGVETVSQDLETFAKHAGRSTVTTDDVLLVTRRNDALHDIIKEFIDKDRIVGGKGKRRQ